MNYLNHKECQPYGGPTIEEMIFALKTNDGDRELAAKSLGLTIKGFYMRANFYGVLKMIPPPSRDQTETYP